jgi:pimeloyl-ACP methyl ester carboxylesterase
VERQLGSPAVHLRRPHRVILAFACVLPVLLTAACYRPQPTTVPLRTLDAPSAVPAAARAADRCLVVFLPGRGDLPEDFFRQGFDRELREAGSACEVVAVDAHLGYYFERSIEDRLRQDVIAPARARGVDEIWLVGISLGGLGSVLYTKENPQEIEGIVILAPYLGEEEVIDEIAAAGGLRAWEPRGPLERFDFRRIWQWLDSSARPGPGRPPIYLAYGERDRFARAHGLLAEALPPGRVITLPGRHTWRTWSRLWSAVLDAGVVPGRRTTMLAEREGRERADAAEGMRE